MTTFHEVLFPVEISYGSTGGPSFKTTIYTADSGYEQRNQDWANVRCEYDASHAIKRKDQMDELLSFFMARRGRAYGFRYQDFLDFEIDNQLIGVGDGSNKNFQIIKTYTNTQAESSTTITYDRKITKPAWGTVSGVTVDGVAQVENIDFTVDYTTGIIHFVTAPAADKDVVLGQCDFHVPVRFDTDSFDVSQDFWETQSWPNIKMVEVRDWNEAIA